MSGTKVRYEMGQNGCRTTRIGKQRIVLAG